MKSMANFSLFLLSSLSFFSIARAQGRAPHGLAYENPVAFSPSAFEFFHPNVPSPNAENPCVKSGCTPLPLSAFTVASSEAHESKASSSQSSGSRVGAGGIALIVFGFIFVVVLALGVYHVVIMRRANINRANSIVDTLSLSFA